MTRRFGAFAVLAVLCACSFDSGKQAKTAKVDIRHVIDSLNSKLVTWYSAGQADSASQIFAQDIWAMPPNSMPIVGRDSLRSYQRNVFAAGKWQFDLKTDDVVSADSIAVERGHYSLKVTAGPQARYPSFEDRGNYVVLWRRDADGHWRQVWETKVSTVPMPMPPKAPASPPTKAPAGG